MSKFKPTSANDFRDMSVEELDAKCQELRSELFVAHSHRKDPKLDVPLRRHILRKDIARLLTVLNEKKRQKSAS